MFVRSFCPDSAPKRQFFSLLGPQAAPVEPAGNVPRACSGTAANESRSFSSAKASGSTRAVVSYYASRVLEWPGACHGPPSRTGDTTGKTETRKLLTRSSGPVTAAAGADPGPRQNTAMAARPPAEVAAEWVVANPGCRQKGKVPCYRGSKARASWGRLRAEIARRESETCGV